MHVVSAGNLPMCLQLYPTKTESYLNTAGIICGVLPALVHLIVRPCYRLHLLCFRKNE